MKNSIFKALMFSEVIVGVVFCLFCFFLFFWGGAGMLFGGAWVGLVDWLIF